MSRFIIVAIIVLVLILVFYLTVWKQILCSKKNPTTQINKVNENEEKKEDDKEDKGIS
jgi:uncharacterized protein YxeA